MFFTGVLSALGASGTKMGASIFTSALGASATSGLVMMKGSSAALGSAGAGLGSGFTVSSGRRITLGVLSVEADFSKPVAMRMTLSSSSRLSSVPAPQMKSALPLVFSRM